MHKAVKNLTNLVKKRLKLPRQRNCSGVMFHLIPIVFQSCKRKENISPTKQSILESMEGEMKNLDD